MLGWLFSRPPLECVEKAWIETHMLWLSHRFGLPRLLAARVVSPESQSLSEEYDATPASGQRLLERIGEQLGMASTAVRLELTDSSCDSSCGGPLTSDRVPGVVSITQEQLYDPPALAALFAHELVRELLPSERWTAMRPPLGEWLIDLAAVYFGLGVLVANAALQEASGADQRKCGCGPRPVEHLPARMVGYALALFAYVRGEAKPSWRTSLQLDSQVAFEQGTKYLHRTGDTLFNGANATRESSVMSTDELLRLLTLRSPSARVAALWGLSDPRHAAQAVEAVSRCLHDRAAALRGEAVKTLAAYGPAARCALPDLIELAHDSDSPTRAAVAAAVGVVAVDAPEVVPALAEQQHDPHRAVVSQSAASLARLGDRAAEAVPALLGALRSAMIRCDHSLMDTLTHTLFTLDSDPTDRVMEYFADDVDLREQTVHLIVDSLQQQREGDPFA